MATRFLPFPSPHPGAVRLAVLPHSGASAVAFLGWRAALPAWVEVLPLELPGRGTRIGEAPDWSMEALGDEIAELLEAELDRPLVLFGHSMGALIAFEVARAMRAGGASPTRLVLSGARPPHLEPRFVLEGHERDDLGFAESLRPWGGASGGAWLDDPELRALFLPVMRADFRALNAYAYAEEPPLELPLAALGGDRDPFVSPEHLAAWGHHTRGPFRHVVHSGDHFYLLGRPEPFLRELLAELEAARAA